MFEDVDYVEPIPPEKLLVSKVSRYENHAKLYVGDFYPRVDFTPFDNFFSNYDLSLKKESKYRLTLIFDGKADFSDVSDDLVFPSFNVVKENMYNLYHRRVFAKDVFHLNLRSPFTLEEVFNELDILSNNITAKLPYFEKRYYLDHDSISEKSHSDYVETVKDISIDEISETIKEFYDVLPHLDYLELVDENVNVVLLLDNCEIWIIPDEWKNLERFSFYNP